MNVQQTDISTIPNIIIWLTNQHPFWIHNHSQYYTITSTLYGAHFIFKGKGILMHLPINNKHFDPWTDQQSQKVRMKMQNLGHISCNPPEQTIWLREHFHITSIMGTFDTRTLTTDIHNHSDHPLDLLCLKCNFLFTRQKKKKN